MPTQVSIQEHGGINIKDQVNDHMEEDDDIDNIVEEDGTHILILETFNNVGMENDDSQYDDRDFDLHVPERETKPLLKAKKHLLSLLYCCWST